MLFFLGGSSDGWFVVGAGMPPNRSLGLGWPCSWIRRVSISGRGGLGVSALDGLVNPVSLVRSTVEARLILLVMERLRWRDCMLDLASETTVSSSC